MKLSLITLLFLLTFSTVYSQDALREDLYVKGKELYAENNFRECLIYLSTYRTINVEYLKEFNAKKLAQIDAAIDYSKRNMKVVPQLSQRTTGPVILDVNGHTVNPDGLDLIEISGKLYLLKAIENINQSPTEQF